MARYLVTGGNRGIGLELCRQLSSAGHDVIATCRGDRGDLAALDVRVEEGVDVTDEASVCALAARVDSPIGVLIHNAGILERVSLEELDPASIRRQFEVNALGPLRVTRALLGRLDEGSKIGVVTSLMGSMTDNTSGGHYGYRMSKAAVNAAAVSLSHDLRPRGIAVAILHPGMVQTAMTGHRGIPPEESVRGILRLLDELTLDSSGTFWHAATGRELPW